MSLENTDAGNPAGSAVADVPANGSNGAAPDMDTTMRNAYREAMARAESTADVTDGAGQETPQQGRQRGPDGKFLPKANGVQQPAQQAAGTEETPPVEGEQTEAPLEPKPHDAAPNTWRKELAAEFGKLPENVREEIHRRENDFHRGIGQYKEAAGFGQQMAQELLPYQQAMVQSGTHPREVVKQLASAWNTLANGQPQEKAQMMLQLMQQYGIDFATLGADPQQGTTQTQDDPRLAAALQRLEKLEGTLSTQERQRAEAEYSAHVESVNRFGSDPKHKHFAAVREEMAALIESGRAKDLEDAYDKAIWLNPEVRKSLLAEQEKERADKAAKEAAAARKAAGANVTRRGTPPVPPKTGRIEDTIQSRYRELMGS